MEQFVYKNHKKLRYGYTTGSCAAAASKAAAAMLLSGKEISYVELHTPKGIDLRLEVLDISREDNAVSCAIQKDGGDDPDVTNGILIYAKVSREPADEAQIIIDGGIGVGRVTKPGLEQSVGAAAINKVPRQMIRENLEAVCEQYHYHGKLSVVISIPSGVELAAKTFNPRLGIVGGISVLGTSGIVEPMSEQALIDTIRVEMRQKLANGMEYLLVVPGNYGIDFGRCCEMQQFRRRGIGCSGRIWSQRRVTGRTYWKICKACRRYYEYSFAQCRCANGASDCSRSVAGCTGGAASEDDGVCDYR